MGDGTIIDLEEIRRIRAKAAESIQASEEGVQTAVVRLAVRGKDQIEFSIDDSVYTLTEEVARSWVRHLHEAIRKSRIIGEPICATCERHGCRRAHPGQQWKRKSDGKMATVQTVFGGRIQLLQESGRETTVTGQHRLQQRYYGPWDWQHLSSQR
jgi:hypothetical protein